LLKNTHVPKLLTTPWKSFGIIAELSKNAKKSTRTRNNKVLYSRGKVPACGLKNNQRSIFFLKPIRNCKIICLHIYTWYHHIIYIVHFRFSSRKTLNSWWNLASYYKCMRGSSVFHLSPPYEDSTIKKLDT